ncbi:hypothetical protein E1B28_003965 [Marasmius oreades]|uniref:Uncharacterized protein n=1 Tax=Marasmius oreades TaxID=181124 RepID=A0A9P8ACE3_9AGAR|nr:uncharacterized protein E1B28_003965 [Marasmius oreades]KAG7096538.1 hypothetical protein E1B28_003965 [Marasmius oreades]
MTFPNILFEAPPTATASKPPAPWSSRSTISFDPYHPDSFTPHSENAYDSYQPILLLPTQEEQHFSTPKSPRSPRLLQKKTKRTGKVPKPLSVTAFRSPHRDDESPGLHNPYDKFQSRHPSTATEVDSFLNTPSPFSDGFPSPSKARRHPIPFASKGFEPPEWKKIILHVFLCVVSYPFLLLVIAIANERTIFWCRTIVGIGCGIVGVSLGLSLMELAKAFLEAATWATLIHQSNVPVSAPGVRLKDLSTTVQLGATIWSGLRLMWARYVYSGTARRARKAYDKRPWSLFIVFFLCTSTLAALLTFILGRIIDIETKIVRDRVNYHEVTVKGDLSVEDINRAAALTPIFNSFSLTWTISPFSALGNLPPSIALRWKEDYVYFAEVSTNQLRSDSTGFGTFKQETTAASIDTLGSNQSQSATDTSPGTTLRFPRWGIRIQCKKLSNGNVNIVPRSPGSFSYVVVPRDDIRELFKRFNMDLPSIVNRPFNKTEFAGNDTLPSNIDFDQAFDWASGKFYDNGVAHSFKSFPITMGAEGLGWQSVETLLVRLNDAFAPQGKFQIKSENTVPTPIIDEQGRQTIIQSHIGYDAAVCVRLIEPYVLEVYNSSIGLPTTTVITSKGGHIADDVVDGITQTFREGDLVTDLSVTRELNSTQLAQVYDALHSNSINQVLKDNGRDMDYVPSPTLVSYTGGSSPTDYTELSPEFFAKAKAKADSASMLPYFAGSGDAVAWAFRDQVLAVAHVQRALALGLLGLILALGLIAGFFVPKLPMDVPRRGFELFSWFAAFQANELSGDRPPLLRKRMHLDDIEKEFGDLKFRYAGFQ